jgi:hypothetical protein
MSTTDFESRLALLEQNSKLLAEENLQLRNQVAYLTKSNDQLHATISRFIIDLPRRDASGRDVLNLFRETPRYPFKLTTSLNLRGYTNLGDESIRDVVSNCPNLTFLDVSQLPNTTETVSNIVVDGLPQLRTLRLTKANDASIANIARKLPNLTELAFEGAATGTTDACCASLASMKSLKTLTIVFEAISEVGFQSLAKSKSITSLVVPAGSAALGEMAQLESLSVFSGEKLDNAGIVEIAKLRSLKKLLILVAPSVTDLSAFEALTALESVYLFNFDGLTAGGIGSLASLPRLATAVLAGANVSTEIVEALSTSKSITTFLAAGGKVGPAALDAVATMTQLTQVGLGGPGIDSTGRIKLQEALPETKIFDDEEAGKFMEGIMNFI